MSAVPNDTDRIVRQLEELERRLAALRDTAAENAATQLMVQALTDLGVTVEELRVAEEEIRQQADELAAANELLNEERRRYQDLFDFAPEGYLVTDARGVIREANQAASQLLDRPAEHLPGKPLAVYVDAESLHEFRTHLLKAAQFEAPLNWDMRLKRPAGDLCFVTCHLAPIRDAGTKALLELRWFLHDVTERRQAEREVEAARERLAEVSVRMETVREEERRRIAQAVHDEIGAALTAIKIDVSQAHHGLGELAPGREGGEKLLGHTSAALHLIDDTMQTVRRIAMDMRPAILDDFGLVAALDWQLSEFEKRTGVACEFSVKPGQAQVPPALATAIYRVFQEILTNIARHAAATRVRVRLYESEGSLVLHGSDNGRGIEESAEARPESLGLLGMTERVRPFGGTVELRSEPGQGTAVLVSVPLGKAPPNEK